MYTILVADDEEELRRAIIRKIDWESIGFRVVGEAENGVEALEMVERMEPDLLLTDIRMPFLSGIELARQVREVRPATQIAFLSGHDDFSYAQQAIQYNIISYMLKPITMADLSEELAAIKSRLDGIFEEFQARSKEQTDVYGFVAPLLLDAYRSPEEDGREELLLERAVSSGLLKDRNNSFVYVVTATSMWDEEGANVTAPNMVHSVDTILQKYVRFCSFYMEGRIVSLLVATKSAFERYLHILVGDVLQSMERILGLKCRMGVSRTEEKLVGCHEAYCEAMNALSYSKGEASSVHYISDEEREEDWDLAGIEDWIVDMENLIRGGSGEELEEYLARLFDSIQAEREGNGRTRFLLLQLFSAVCRIVYAVADKEAVRELQDISFMQSALSPDAPASQIAEKFSAFCQTARDMVRCGRKKSSQVLCEQTLYIIEKDYSNPDMSLVSVSAQINVSPNYLSALMKKQTGVSFVDILTKKRMDAARELLAGTGMKIREISERCGYNDQHYFSYCFKKYWGESPNSFRQQLQG